MSEGVVARLFGHLDGERDLRHQALVSTVLLEEENRFGRVAAKIDQLELYISQCDAHIRKYEPLINDGDHSDGQKHLSKLVQNVTDIRTTLRLALIAVHDRLQRLERP